MACGACVKRTQSTPYFLLKMVLDSSPLAVLYTWIDSSSLPVTMRSSVRWKSTEFTRAVLSLKTRARPNERTAASSRRTDGPCISPAGRRAHARVRARACGRASGRVKGEKNRREEGSEAGRSTHSGAPRRRAAVWARRRRHPRRRPKPPLPPPPPPPKQKNVFAHFLPENGREFAPFAMENFLCAPRPARSSKRNGSRKSGRADGG